VKCRGLIVATALIMVGCQSKAGDSPTRTFPPRVTTTTTNPAEPATTVVNTSTSDYEDEPEFIFDTQYVDKEHIYECSRPIKLQKRGRVGTMLGGERTVYLPVDTDEANLFCHDVAIIEYKGKLTVLQKPEVLDLIGKYQYKDVTIKALEFKYIQDKEFVNRLLPQYRDREIGCIIILETPKEKLVFLEDEKLETFEQMDYKLFDKQLDRISPADRQIFLDNLR